MQSFSLGWGFLKQAVGMAFQDRDLIKPSLYALAAGLLVSLVGIVPMALAYLIFGEQGLGGYLTLLIGAVFVFAQFVVSYVFSAMTVYLIYGYLSEGDGRMDKAWAIVRRDFWDILTLAAASTAVNLIKNLARRNRRDNFAANLARSAAGLLETLWSEAAHLILPAMVIDDLNLKDALRRVGQIVKENLLLAGISVAGVRFVSGLIGFFVALLGLALAGLVVFGTLALEGGAALTVGGLILAALIFFPFAMLASAFSSYVNTAYYACLYIWARDVEKARARGVAERVPAPAPLAAVLG